VPFEYRKLQLLRPRMRVRCNELKLSRAAEGEALKHEDKT